MSDQFDLDYEVSKRRSRRERIDDLFTAHQEDTQEAEALATGPAPEALSPARAEAQGAAPLGPGERPDSTPLGRGVANAAHGFGRGVALGTANAMDSAFAAGQALLEAVGLEHLDPVGPVPQEQTLDAAVRGATEEPEGVGQLTQPLGQVASLLIPGLAALKGAGMASAVGRSLTAGPLAAGLAFGPEDPNVSEAAIDFSKEFEGTIWENLDNPLTRALATNENDDRLTRFIKNAAEDVALAGTAEFLFAAGRVARANVMAASRMAKDVPTPPAILDEVEKAARDVEVRRAQVESARTARAELRGAVANDDLSRKLRMATRSDEGLDSAATVEIPAVRQRLRAAILDPATGDVSTAAEGTGHSDAFESFAEGLGVRADEVADDVAERLREGFVDLETGEFVTRQEAAATARELVGGEALELPEGVGPAVDRVLGGSVEEAVGEAEGALSRSEDALLGVIQGAGDQMDPRVVETLRQVLRDHSLPNGNGEALDEALGAVATRLAEVRGGVADVAPPARQSVFNNSLEATTEQVAALESAAQNGDLNGAVEGASNVLASVFDSTNFERIAESGDIKELVAGVAEVFGRNKGSRRPTPGRTLETTEAMAERLIREDAADLALEESQVAAVIDDLVATTDDLDVKTTALRSVEMGLAKKVHALADANAIRTDKTQAAEFLRWATLLANVTDARAGVSSQIGRALGAHRIGSRDFGLAELLGNQGQALTSIDNIIRGGGGQERIARLAAQFSNNAAGNLSTARKLASQVDTRRGIVREMAYELYVTNILSGLATHAVNVFGNSMASMWLMADEFVDSSVRALRTQDPRAFQGFQAYTKGMYEGFRSAVLAFDGIKPVGTAFQAGRRGDSITVPGRAQFANEAADLSAISSASFRRIGQLSGPRTRGVINRIFAERGLGGRLVDGFGRFQRWPFHALAAGDEIAKAINYHAALNKRAWEAAADAAGADLPGATARVVSDAGNLETLAKRALANPADVDLRGRLTVAREVNEEAIELARLGTFTKDPGAVTRGLQQLRTAIPATKFILPFVQTPSNIMSFALVDRGPLGIARRQFWKDLRAGGAQRQKALSRHATGTALAGASAYLVFSGQLTGHGPTNQRDRVNWLAEGNEPYSIRVPIPGQDRPLTLRISRLDPTAMPAMIVADMVEMLDAIEDPDMADRTVAFAAAMANIVNDKSYLSGISDFIRAATEPGTFGQNYVVRFASNFVPQSAMLRQFQRFGLPGDLEALIPEESADDPILGTLQELATGQMDIPNVERNQGFYVQLADQVRANLPQPLQELASEVATAIFGSRISAERVGRLDMFAEPLKYSPVFVAEGPTDDPVRAEVARVGAFVSTKGSHARLVENRQSIDLTPEQQRFWVEKSFSPSRKRLTLREKMATKIFGTKDPKPGAEPLASWTRRTEDEQLQRLDRIRMDYRKSGKRDLLKKFPELGDQLRALREQKRAERREARQSTAQSSELQSTLNSLLGGS